MKTQCECSDPGCFEHSGRPTCTKKAKHIVRRFDMEDGETAFEFCNGCTEDALESGVFALEE